jgi:YfiH family protein
MFKIFKRYPIIVSLSQKRDGSMRLFNDPFSDRKVLKNRKKFLKKIGIKEKDTVVADLIHNSKVKIVSKKDKGKIIKKTDGLITKEKNLFLTITVADCLPIFIYEPEKEIVGLVHLSWRNLKKGILKKTLNLFKKLGAKKNKILLGIGPSICQKHFEVKEDLLKIFKPYLKEALLKKEDKYFLDLKKICLIQLKDSGIKKENIETSKECTYCLKNKYFSFRRDKPKKLKAMMAVIGKKF